MTYFAQNLNVGHCLDLPSVGMATGYENLQGIFLEACGRWHICPELFCGGH